MDVSHNQPRNMHLRDEAHRAFAKALAAGEVIRNMTCTSCGSTAAIEGHHTDYSKPLTVIWLCRSCHRKCHGRFLRNGPMKNLREVMMAWRKHTGLPQYDAAKRIGISAGALSFIDNGWQPNGKDFAKLLRWLLDEDRSTTPEQTNDDMEDETA